MAWRSPTRRATRASRSRCGSDHHTPPARRSPPQRAGRRRGPDATRPTAVGGRPREPVVAGRTTLLAALGEGDRGLRPRLTLRVDVAELGQRLLGEVVAPGRSLDRLLEDPAGRGDFDR